MDNAITRATARERVVTYLTQMGKEQPNLRDLCEVFRDIPKGTIGSIISLAGRTEFFGRHGSQVYISSTKGFTTNDVLLAIKDVETKAREKRLGITSERPSIHYDHIVEMAENLLSALRVNKKAMQKMEKVKKLLEDK